MAKNVLLIWKKYFTNAGIRADLVEKYLAYIKVLAENDVAIIFDLKHLSLLLGRSESYLASVINASEHHYRMFQIPKRSGGKREITTPYPALLECQYWIYHNVLRNRKIHPTAHGFTFNKSIISNARVHLSQEDFLKIDLKDFFPSIQINRVIAIFQSLGYTKDVSFYLAALCCKGRILPQGSPTSPIISNLVAKGLDARLFGLAQSLGLKYTRYADDLAFSGEKIAPKILEYVSEIVSDAGFTINEHKTRLQQGAGRRILTGISIAGNKLAIPRAYKRKLKQEVHFIRKFGALSHVLKKKIKVPNYLGSIIGRLKFWLTVEPDNAFAKKACEELELILYGHRGSL